MERAGKLVRHNVTGDWGVTVDKSALHSGRWWVHWLTNQFDDGMTVTEEPSTDIQFVTSSVAGEEQRKRTAWHKKRCRGHKK